MRSPRAQGGYAARFEVRDGEDPLCRAGYGCFGDRAEVQADSQESEGRELWYDWSIRFARDFPRTSEFQVVTQWHSEVDGSPPVALYAGENEVYLRTDPHDSSGREVRPPEVRWSGPMRRGTWQRFRLHVLWSGSDRRGFLELFVNGRRATGRVRTRTLYPGRANYLKLGYYREAGIRRPGVVYQDGMRVSRVR